VPTQNTSSHCSSEKDDIVFFLPTDDEEISLSAEPESSAETQDSIMNSMVGNSNGEPSGDATEFCKDAKPESPSEGNGVNSSENQNQEHAGPVEEAAGAMEARDGSNVSEAPEEPGELQDPEQHDTQPTLSAEEVAEGLPLDEDSPSSLLPEENTALGSKVEEETVPENGAREEEMQKGKDEEEEEEDVSTLEQGEPGLELRVSVRKKSRPCSLPVSELETVIASACGDAETPRTHYIRIHTLLHSMPSAQRGSTTEEEDGLEEESTLKESSEKDGLSEVDTIAADPQSMEDGESDGATLCMAPSDCSGGHFSSLSKGIGAGQDGEAHPSTGSESDSSPQQGADHSCEGCDASCCSPSCYSTSCYSSSCYSSSCYSSSCYNGNNRFASHTRFSSVDSAKISESTVFSSQEDEEEENSAFESVPDSVQSPELDPESTNGAGPWQDELAAPGGNAARSTEGLESPMAGPSNRREG
jgi:E3 ubiquitin-protein ligase HECW1